MLLEAIHNREECLILRIKIRELPLLYFSKTKEKLIGMYPIALPQIGKLESASALFSLSLITIFFFFLSKRRGEETLYPILNRLNIKKG
jgi:hypothetical protein